MHVRSLVMKSFTIIYTDKLFVN
uniref:Uncharacterized protein n=1 Tax=Anguilla anguilla TaxID=7936 RepID=A0A0E9W857_ANGAN